MTQYQGVDLTAEAGETATPFSWHTPHPIFVIILVGQEEIPFGIQKDLLCTQSPYFRDLFNQAQWADKIEHIFKLPNYDSDVFGCFQNFIFAGKVYDGKVLPSYQILLGVWKLAVELRMAPLRIAVMDTMSERRTLTSAIPSTALLIQAWQETAEGSGLRLMLINWAAEHMRASPEIRNTFAKSLPKEILSELVIIMAGLPVPVAPPQAIQQVSRPSTKPNTSKRENPTDDVPQYQGSNKRSRISVVATANEDGDLEFKPKPTSTPTTTKKAPRKSQGGRRNTRTELNEEPNPDREMAFCSDLITRMLSAPGFWTRLVAPFRDPVDPIADNVPNYFSVIKKPICLRDIKAKMDAGQYATAQEFEADMRQIFSNCYEYWTQEDAIFKSCEQLERSFNDKFAARDKWRGATIKAEIIED